MSKKMKRTKVWIQCLLICISLLFFGHATLLAAENIEISVETDTGKILSDISVYAFTESGSYTGISEVTDLNGIATFTTDDFDAGNYKFRIDYLGNQFWSDILPLPETIDSEVIINEESVQVTVLSGSNPLEDINVYLFSGTGSYLSINEITDIDGNVGISLPVGRQFKFRADVMGSQYWSAPITIQDSGINYITIDTGGGELSVTIESAPGVPMEGINTYLFSSSDSYLGISIQSDSSGTVKFNVTEGEYKVRADYLGEQFWSDNTIVDQDTNISIMIPHQDVDIIIEGKFQEDTYPIEGITVYLFTPSGSYMNQSLTTDAQGRVTFNLPEQPYMVRADYLGKQFWSEEFTWQDTTVQIPMADAEITVTGAGLPLENVPVYVFSESGAYLNINGTTDSEGSVSFRLPSGTYKFRADYQGSQYWSSDENLSADQVNPVAISTGGGLFELTVLKNVTDPLTGVTCYVFSESGAYLSLSAVTDENGKVSFSLADGTYKIRVDYLGVQFWTDLLEIPTTLSSDLLISHQDITITVQETYLSNSDPVQGIPVYLFTPSGSYMNHSLTTDTEGSVTFNLPEQPYKVRADYLGQQFWSEEFTWQNKIISIPQGMAQVNVSRFGAVQAGANVYLFTESGSYLNTNNITDGNGQAEFIIPAGSYTFRADEGGDQQWSDTVSINADQATVISIEMEDLPPTVTLSADPSSIESGQSTTLTWNTTNADSVSIDQGIGDVSLDGTITVTPDETTVYTITATGAGGTETASVTVEVSQVLPDEFKIIAGDPLELARFGYSVAISGEYVIVGAPGDDMFFFPVEGAAYIFKRDGPSWVQQAKLMASDSAVFNNFGSSVSIDGDYAVVGSVFSNGLEDYEGAAYVFKREGETWTEQAKLIAGEPTNGFGSSVSISGDYLVVGADWHNSAGNFSGAAFVFMNNAGTWEKQAKLVPNDIEEGDTFGNSVVINSDYIVIGAKLKDGAEENSGAVYVYKKDGVSWVEQTKLVASDAEEDYYFGESVSMHGDYIAVGASYADSGDIEYAGAVYLFKRESDVWTEETKIFAADAGQEDQFGISVSIYDDNLLVGATRGSAYLFVKYGDVWAEAVKFVPSDGAEYDAFGKSLALNEYYAIVGSPHHTYNSFFAPGAAYIYTLNNLIGRPSIEVKEPDGIGDIADQSFTIKWSDSDFDNNATIALYFDTDNSGADGTLIADGIYEDPDEEGDDEFTWDTSEMPEGFYHIYAVIDDGDKGPVIDYSNDIVIIDHDIPQEVTFYPEGAAGGERFGESVAIDGNYAIVGARGDNIGGTATILQKSGTEWIQDAKIIPGDGSSGDYFGCSVSIKGNYAIIGAMYDDDGGDSSGSAYIYKKNGVSWTLQAKLTASDAEDDDCFGASVSINGDFAVVGARGDDDGGTNAGAVYIFSREGDSWSEIDKKTGTEADYFGRSVSMSGNYLMAGATGDDEGAEDSGAAYIFKFDGNSWIEQSKLKASVSSSDADFGCSVSISNNHAIIGTNGYGDDGNRLEAAYIFERDGDDWSEQIKLKPGDVEACDYFGLSVSIDAEYAIVGSYNDGQGSGSAYVYKLVDGSWILDSKIVAGDASKYECFGSSVAVFRGNAVVGAYGKESYSGAVYFYQLYNDDDLDGLPDEWELENFGDLSQGPEDDYDGDQLVNSQEYELGTDPTDGNPDSDTDNLPDWWELEYFGDLSQGPDGDYDEDGYSNFDEYHAGTDPSYVTENYPPSIKVTEPDGENDTADTVFTIQWTDDDPDDNAMISLFYDTDNTGANGILIAEGFSEDGADDQYSWNTSGMAEGEYYIYAIIEDQLNEPVTVYSAGPVTVNHPPPDNDSDGLPDEWEVTYFGDLSQGPNDDFDGDQLTNIQEYQLGTDPTDSNPDTDSDSLPDWWELSYFGDLNQGPDDDFDEDGYSNYKEYQAGTDPGTVTVNAPPSITITEPDGGDDYPNTSFTIMWTDEDPDSSAKISLYYDTDDAGADGILIVSDLEEDADEEGDEYVWDTSLLLDWEEYYVYAVIDDGLNDPVVVYSESTVYIDHAEGRIFGDSTDCSQAKFGYAIDMDGDLAVIGAPEDGTLKDGGIYIFNRNGLKWSKQLRIEAPHGDTFFGASVAIDGEYIIAGAPHYGADKGSAYIFKWNGTEWIEEDIITASDGSDNAYFGKSVAISGDYAIVGAWGDSELGDQTGAAYIFKREGAEWVEQIKLTSNIPNDLDYFGWSVAMEGDTAIVGSWGSGVMTWGKAYIFRLEGDNWIQKQVLQTIDESSQYRFGYSVDIDGNYLVVGAIGGEDWEIETPGAAHVFKWDGDKNKWVGDAILTAASPEVFDYFGHSVAIDNDKIIVGATGVLEGDEEGAVYIFEREDGVWDESSLKFYSYDPVADDNFGFAVAISGPFAFAGAPASSYLSDDNAVCNGEVYTYLVSYADISADDENIVYGESTELTWNIIDAISVTIDNGIGEVSASGSITIYPTETTTYTITAETPWITFIESVTIVVEYLDISIYSPYDQDIIERPDIRVEGTITNPKGLEVGVNVNGVVALVEGDQFIANHVPLEEGENTITVTAVDSNGNTAMDIITVYYQSGGNYITLSTDTESGISPLEVILSLDSSFTIESDPVIDYIGPGVVEFLDNDEEGEYTVRMTTEGLYQFIAQVEYEGVTYEDTVAILVMDADELDAMLQAKWNGMKTALIAGDVEEAASYFSTAKSNLYMEFLQLIPNDQVNNLIPGLERVEWIGAENSSARYVADIDIIVNGEDMTISSYITFERDEDGIWRINSF